MYVCFLVQTWPCARVVTCPETPAFHLKGAETPVTLNRNKQVWIMDGGIFLNKSWALQGETLFENKHSWLSVSECLEVPWWLVKMNSAQPLLPVRPTFSTHHHAINAALSTFPVNDFNTRPQPVNDLSLKPSISETDSENGNGQTATTKMTTRPLFCKYNAHYLLLKTISRTVFHSLTMYLLCVFVSVNTGIKSCRSGSVRKGLETRNRCTEVTTFLFSSCQH